MWSRNVVVALGFLSLLSVNEALRVLVFFPLGSKSHSILGQGFVTHLLKAGHEVVHITSFPRAKPVANLTEISTEAVMNSFMEQAEKMDTFKLKNLVGKGNIGDSLFFLYFAYDFHRQVYEHSDVINLLSDPNEKFDAAIVEWFFHDSVAGIAPLLQCPLIWVGSTEAHWQTLKLIDEIPNPSYNVDLFSTSSPPMTFWQRALEMWTVVKKSVILNCLVGPFEKMLYNRVYSGLAAKRGVTMPSYNEAVYNGSLMFLNSHPSIGTPFRLPQSAKYIAGYHIDNNIEPLPKDLQKLMDESEHGVIYFSMGSNLKSKDMSDEMRDSLLQIFGQLKQNVIWKFEIDLQNTIPPNVHLVKWAPQQSILAHPNLKMFITHGGQLSTTESIHYAVPIIGIPVVGDQHVNMKSVAHRGFGIRVTLTENLAEDLAIAIKEMLSNPSYRIKAKELSLMYHDRPVSPGAELVHWVQHVVRTRGAPHLRSPALHVPLYQKLYLDLLAVILATICILKIVIKRLFFSKQKVNVQKKIN